MQLGEFTSFRGVTSKSYSIFAGESRFYDHYQSQYEDTVMKIAISAEFTGILFWEAGGCNIGNTQSNLTINFLAVR